MPSTGTNTGIGIVVFLVFIFLIWILLRRRKAKAAETAAVKGNKETKEQESIKIKERLTKKDLNKNIKVALELFRKIQSRLKKLPPNTKSTETPDLFKNIETRLEQFLKGTLNSNPKQEELLLGNIIKLSNSYFKSIKTGDSRINNNIGDIKAILQMIERDVLQQEAIQKKAA